MTMRNDPAQFFASLGELYSIWPNFFYAIGAATAAVTRRHRTLVSSILAVFLSSDTATGVWEFR